MLAQNFKTAAELYISKKEHAALIATLHALDRGELVHGQHGQNIYSDLEATRKPIGFNMDRLRTWTDCGTVACLKGWAMYFAADSKVFNQILRRNLGDLFMYKSLERPETMAWDRKSVTPEQAAHALRNYLTSGEARWGEVFAAHAEGAGES